MLPIWIMGSNIDTSNPLQSPNDKLREKHEKEKENKEDNKREKENSKLFNTINKNVDKIAKQLSTNGTSSGSSNSNSNGETINNSGGISSSSNTVTSGNSMSNSLNSNSYNTGKGSSIIDKATSWAVKIANDDSHGYDQTHRQGPDYDCSSLVSNAYAEAGLKINRNNSTSVMYDDFIKNGFKDVTSATSNGTNIKALQKGDVLLTPNHHTEMYLGNGKQVGAHQNEFKGITGGQTGDQTGHEIDVYNAPGNYYQYVLRYPGKFTNQTYSNSKSKNTNNSGTANTIRDDSTDYNVPNLKSNVASYKSMNGWKSSYSDYAKELENQAKKNKSSSAIKDNSISKIIDSDENNSKISSINNNIDENLNNEHKKYYEDLVGLLKLIEKNTSNIPKTNTILNEILNLISDNDNTNNEDDVIPDVTKASLFGPIDSDISLIATGI